MVKMVLYPHDEPVLLAYYIKKLFLNTQNVCSEISGNAVETIKKYTHPLKNAEQNIEIYEEIMRLEG